MKKLHFSFSLPFLLTVASCGTQLELDHSQVSREVQTMFDSYVQEVNNKGIEQIGRYFSDDEHFRWVEDGVLQYPDKAALVAGIESFLPSVASIDLSISKSDITVINESMATIFAQYKQDVILQSGYKFTLDGAMTILIGKERNEWKFLEGHSSIKKPRGDG